MTKRLRLLVLSAAVFALMGSTGSARADTLARGIGFDGPVLVDQFLGGGEPIVMWDGKAKDYIYSAHEGTTHTDHDGVAGSPDNSAVWGGNYRNQVNVWTSGDGFKWTKVSWNGTGFTNNPLTNTGFSDPDLTMDAGGRVYDTGIDLANDALFSSTDGGKTWPTGTINCHDGDRPWLAGGSKPNEVWLATDTVEGTLSHQIFQSTDGGASCGATGIPDAGTIPKTSPLAGGEDFTGYGKLRYSTHGPLAGALVEPIIVSGKTAAVGISVLKNAEQAFKTGKGTFVPRVVSITKGWLTLMPSVDVDSAGDVFLTWADNPPDKAKNPTGLNKVYLDMSRDGGMTWLPHPIVVAQASKVKGPHRGTVLWPWVAAGSKGNVSVVWYQYDQLVPDPDQATCNCNVSVMDANLFGVGTSSFHQRTIDAAGRPIHVGNICQSGTTCVVTGQDRRLGDYFTNNLDGRGCVIIASADTTEPAPISGRIRAWGLPLFLHQNAGPSLTTGKTCGSGARAHHPSSHHHSHHRRGSHHRRAHHRTHHRHHRRHDRPSRRPRHRSHRGFTG